jgi:hypothetical protein
MNCKSESSQPFPSSGRLKKNMNLSLGELREIIGDTQAKVYSYIVATVKNSEGCFIQTGSAPNFQGGVISLCTCKHRMRSFQDPDSWPGTWIAGFSSKKAGNGGRNALIYLMKVEIAFKSFYDLWYSGKTVKQVKLAHVDKFGDVFLPKPDDKRDKYDVEHYLHPVADHVHAPKDWWHKDINYGKGVCGRKAALLFGDEQYSFLWNKPTLIHSKQLHRAQRKDDLQSFLKCLNER